MDAWKKAKNLCKNSNQQSKYVGMNVYANDYCMSESVCVWVGTCVCVYVCDWVSQGFMLCEILFRWFFGVKSLNIAYHSISIYLMNVWVCVCVRSFVCVCVCCQVVLLPFSHPRWKWSRMKLMPCLVSSSRKRVQHQNTRINVCFTYVYSKNLPLGAWYSLVGIVCGFCFHVETIMITSSGFLSIVILLTVEKYSATESNITNNSNNQKITRNTCIHTRAHALS